MEYHAVAALRASLEICKSFEQIRIDLPQAVPELTYYIGVHAGDAYIKSKTARTGTDARVDREADKVLAVIKALDKPGEVLVSEITRRKTQRYFEFVPVPGLTMPPQSQGLIYRVTGRKPGYDLLAHASRDAIPLIGNDNELGILKRLWQETTRGMPRVIWIDGIPGIGKSRLLTEFLSLLRAVGGIHILTFQCWPFHKTTAYHPIIEMIRDYLYRLGTDKPAVVEQAVRVGATRWGIEDEQMIRTVISLLCPGPVSSPDDDVVSEGQVFEWTEGASIRKEMPDTFYRVLCMLSNDKPVVMAVENLEWADPSTRELLRHLVDRLSTEGQRQRILYNTPAFLDQWIR